MTTRDVLIIFLTLLFLHTVAPYPANDDLLTHRALGVCTPTCDAVNDAMDACPSMDSSCICSEDSTWTTDLERCINCYEPFNKTMVQHLGQYERLCSSTGASTCAMECATSRRGVTACSITYPKTLSLTCACDWDNSWDANMARCLGCLQTADPSTYATWEPMGGICSERNGGDSDSNDGGGAGGDSHSAAGLSKASFGALSVAIVAGAVLS